MHNPKPYIASLLLLTALLCSYPAAAVIRYVKTGSAGTAPYTSWATASNDLQAVINASSSGDQIWVAAGTYVPMHRSDVSNGTGPQTLNNRFNSFVMKTGVSIYGGFVGNEISLALRNYTTNVTILSGDIGTAITATDNCYHVLISASASGGGRLDGFTVRDGYADYSATNITVYGQTVRGNRAGGIYIVTANPDIYNCIIRKNTALDGAGGGGIFSSSTASPVISNCSFIQNSTSNASAPGTCYGGGIVIGSIDPQITTLTGCTFSSNSADAEGGGVYVGFGGNASLSNCIFTSNSAFKGGALGLNTATAISVTDCQFTSNTATQKGGAIYDSISVASITNCTFNSNTALTGGSIFNYNSTCNISSGTFTGNSATGGFGPYNIGGGSIADLSTSTTTITNCSFTNSTSNHFGGAISSMNGDDLTISNCNFSNNTATNSGGGIYSSLALLKVTNSSFLSNTASSGGAINSSSVGAAGFINDCIFAGNSASANGGAVFLDYSDVSLTNCMITGNKASMGGGIARIGDHNSGLISNCTIASNLATSAGGGIYTNLTAIPGNTLNSILWGNKLGLTVNNISVTGSPIFVQYSAVGGGFAGTGNINSDPLFVNPQPASVAPTTAGDYRLLKCSPAINTGNNSSIPPATTTDLDGNARIAYQRVDMGAYEKQSLSFAVPDASGIVYVDNAKSGDGSSWTSALQELGDALLEARFNNTIQEIWVAKGTYKPKFNAADTSAYTCSPAVSRYNAFILVNNVKLYGGFAGNETLLSQRDFITNITILSGDIGVINNNTDNSYHIIISAGAVGTAALDGFTITQANDNGSSGIVVNSQSINGTYGGGIFNKASSPTITNCIFSNNNVTGNGAGIRNESSSSIISNCTFSGNIASGFGGGMDNVSCTNSLVISYCTFSGNSGSSGGGMNNYGASPSIVNCIFSGNSSSQNGGGISNQFSSATSMVNCIISGNTSVQFGGAIYYNSSSVLLNNCNIVNNRSAFPGGGVYLTASASLTLNNSIVWGNKTGTGTNNISIASGTVNASYSDIEGGYAGTGNMNADPLFMNPQPASSAPTTLGDYRLQSCSPSIDAGNNTLVPSGITFDLDANARIFNTTVDMGAYELQTVRETFWKGLSSDWNTPSNWCDNIVPVATTNVYVPSGVAFFPIINATNAVKNIRVDPSTSLTITSTGSLTINGTYSNSGCSIANNGKLSFAGNAASLVFPGTAGTVTAMNNLEINNTNGIKFNKSFSITGSLIPTTGNINLDNDTITLRSTALGTADIAVIQPGASISYTGTGKFEVQRYIHTGTGTGQHTKSWQFLATPAIGETVFQSWQENGLSPSGFGTWITGTGAGFDATTILPSMKYYDAATGLYKGITNTGDPLLNKFGYMLFVRGDRTVNTYNGTPNSTTVRSRGQVYSPANPPPAVTVAANSFQSFGNPYPSRIEFSKVKALSSGINDVFYVWDPTLAGTFNVGGWQTITGVAGYIPTVGIPPGGNPATVYYPAGVPAPYIESGQAVFVKGNATGGSVNFNENCKASGSRLVNRGFPQNGSSERQLLITSLFTNTGQIADGNIVVFGREFSNATDEQDAVKMMNDGENFGLTRGGQSLAVEARNLPTANDSIFFDMKNLRRQTYQLRFAPKHINAVLTAYLVDNYQHSSTEISLHDSSCISFNINSDPASATANRFMIVFRRKKMRSQEPMESVNKSNNRDWFNSVVKTVPMVSIYPNPITGRTVNLQFAEMPEGEYTLMLINSSGKSAGIYSLKHTDSFNESILLPASIPHGIYLIKINGPQGFEHTCKLIY